MNKKKIVSVLSVIALMAAAVKGSAVTAEAAYNVAGGSVTFASYLVMNENAYIPAESIAYTIAPYGTKTASDASGTPSVGTADFTLGQETFTTVQTMDSNIGVKKQTTSGTDDKDTLTLASGKKYARTAVTVDFTNVNFTNIGTYSYLIKQTKGTDMAVDYDETPMIMQVYVQYQTDSSDNLVLDQNGDAILTVKGYVMYQAAASTVDGTTTYTIQDGSNGTVNTKADGFVNHYETEDLTISKTVTGNQASHDEYFQFDVTLSDVQPGLIFTVDVSGADASTKVNGASNVAHTNVTSLTAASNKSVTQTFWLHHGQSIVIQGLPRGSAYSINEDYATVVTKEGYTPTAQVSGDTANGVYSVLTSATYTQTVSGAVQTMTLNADGTGSYEHTVSGSAVTDTLTWSQTKDRITVTLDDTSSTVYELILNSSGRILATETDSIHLNAQGNPVMSIENNDIEMTESTTVVSDAHIEDNTTVAYTNDKQGSIPTGIITNTAPYAVVVLAGFAGLLFFMKKKREEEAEQE